PEGTYIYPYTICEKLNPDNCSSTTATVVVGAGAIQANDDGVYTVDGSTGKPYVGNALTNDRLNGQPVTLDKITVTVDGTEKEDPSNPGTYIPITPTET